MGPLGALADDKVTRLRVNLCYHLRLIIASGVLVCAEVSSLYPHPRPARTLRPTEKKVSFRIKLPPSPPPHRKPNTNFLSLKMLHCHFYPAHMSLYTFHLNPPTGNASAFKCPELPCPWHAARGRYSLLRWMKEWKHAEVWMRGDLFLSPPMQREGEWGGGGPQPQLRQRSPALHQTLVSSHDPLHKRAIHPEAGNYADGDKVPSAAALFCAQRICIGDETWQIKLNEEGDSPLKGTSTQCDLAITGRQFTEGNILQNDLFLLD